MTARRTIDLRPIIKLRSTAYAGFSDVTQTNRQQDSGRTVLRGYDSRLRRHLELREER